jgi:4-hydroxy-L-threonine phosphate dehydrogenase PdxA
MKNARPILGLTMGDPAGIGPEICLRALREPAVLARCVPVLFGDAGVLERIKKSGHVLVLVLENERKIFEDENEGRDLPRRLARRICPTQNNQRTAHRGLRAIDAAKLSREKFPPRAARPVILHRTRDPRGAGREKLTALSPRQFTRNR